VKISSNVVVSVSFLVDLLDVILSADDKSIQLNPVFRGIGTPSASPK